jgi:DNA-binding transcriptional regulator PaaX
VIDISSLSHDELVERTEQALTKLFFQNLRELVKVEPEPIDLDQLVERAADQTVNASKVLIAKPEAQAAIKSELINLWNFLLAEGSEDGYSR